MEKYIPLQGLANNPSDHDAPDGQLANVLNLIPEDDALKPIVLNDDITDSETAVAIGDSDTTLLYTHIGDNLYNFIISKTIADVPGYYYLKKSSGQATPLPYQPDGFVVNAVSSVGMILTLHGEDTSLYFLWDQQTESYLSVNSLNYAITVRDLYDLPDVQSSADHHNAEISPHVAITFDSGQISVDEDNLVLSDKESREIYNALVAALNRRLSEVSSSMYIRGTVLAVAALRLYDTSYISISNPFVIAPKHRDGYYNSVTGENINGGCSKVDDNYNITSATTNIGFSKYEIRIDMDENVVNSLKNFIDGVDIFISLPLETWDIDVPHEIRVDSDNQHYHFKFAHIGEDELYNRIDSLSFFRSIHIPREKLTGNVYTLLKPVTGGETSISLADFRRTVFSARTTYVYNNRLHVAGTSKDYGNAIAIGLNYILWRHDDSTTSEPFAQFLSNKTPATTDDGEHASINYYGLPNCKAVVEFNDGARIILYGQCTWPLPPLLCFPDRNATRMTLYVNSRGYHKATVELRASDSFGMAYHVFLGDNDEIGFSDDGEASTFIEYRNVEENTQVIKPTRTNNLLRYSEAENPLVFPVNNYVAVGSADIVGLATSTQPISESQFGVAPLYVFTTDATWALQVDNDGSYDVRQPATRDVISNKGSITPIDDAVVFITKRGLMLISGKQSTCISEVLDGVPANFLQMPSAQQVIDDFNTALFQYVDFKSVYAQQARIVYDYSNQRLVVFNPSYSYAYVYSFKSSMWGVVENKFKDVMLAAAQPYIIIDKDGTRYSLHAEATLFADTNVFACTRPLQFDAPFSYKTIRTAILRGYFDRSHLATVLYGSNDLHHWFLVNDSADSYLRGRLGTPWKYFRLAFVGGIAGTESVSGIHADYFVRWNNQLR